jgi:hypothetical protein
MRVGTLLGTSKGASKRRPVAYLLAVVLPILGGAIAMLNVSEEGDASWVCGLGLSILMLTISVLISLLGIWLWLGRTRWQLRLALFCFALTLLETLVLLTTDDTLPPAFSIYWVGSTTFALVIIAGVARMAHRRLKLVGADDELNDLSDMRSTLRFTIFDMMLWSAAVAAVFGIARWLNPDLRTEVWARIVMGDSEAVLVLLSGVPCAFSSIMAAWFVFGSTRFALRLTGLFVAAPLSCVVVIGSWLTYQFGGRAWIAVPGVMMSVALQSVLVMAALWIFRANGYRLESAGGHLITRDSRTPVVVPVSAAGPCPPQRLV